MSVTYRNSRLAIALLMSTLASGHALADCLPFDEAQSQAYDRTSGQLLATPGVYRKSFRVRRPKSTGEVATEAGEIEP